MTAAGPREPARFLPQRHDLHLPRLTLPAERPLFRLCQSRYPDPAYFGRALAYRFDAPDRSYGVCYLGSTLDCCLVEALEVEVDAATLGASITRQTLSQYYAAVAVPRRDLVLARLADHGLNHLRIDPRVSSGDDDVARTWSKAIHDHPGQLDGILYPSRHPNSPYCVALFDRARDALELTVWGTLGDPSEASLWAETARILAECDVMVL